MSSFYGYPESKEGPETGYCPKAGTNPIVRGIPLAVAGSAAMNIKLLSSFLWSNAGFNSLREIKHLESYKPRYDPTVIPITSEKNKQYGIDDINIAMPFERLKGIRCDVAEYHHAFKSGATTPLVVAQTVVDLTKASSEHENAFLSIKKSTLLAEAEASTKRYKDGRSLSILDGVPIGVKDEVDLEGHDKSFATSRGEPCPVGGTSWCVKKWQEAGAIIVGKLNMHELGMDTSNNNPVTGTPLNPHNHHYYTGGSSGGSAYAVSAGLLPFTLGADGGGSIRIPSTYCGIYGLKPSHNRISQSPSVSLAASNGVVGPMASSMADLEIAYRTMAIPDPDDADSKLFAPPIPRQDLLDQKKTIGIYKPWFDHADDAVLNACHSAIAHYGSEGYCVIDVTLPYLPEGQLAHALTILSEISTGIHELGHLQPANKILLSVGKHTPASDFLLAQKLRNLLMQHVSFLFRRYPGLLIVTPTTPNAGWHIAGGAADLKHGISDGNMSMRNMTYIWLANFIGCPALSIPVGMAEPIEGEGKIPIGLMAMAEWGAEESLIEWGKIGEAWAWELGNERVTKPQGWVDVLKIASSK